MKQEFRISGMSCDHCVMHVKESLSGLSGVESVDVDLESGVATVTAGRQLEQSEVAGAVTEAGYQLIGV